MRANARALFAASFVALLLIGALWTWRLLAPVHSKPLVPSSQTRPKPYVGLNVLAMLEEAVNSSSVDTPNNPFRPRTFGLRKIFVPPPVKPVTQTTTPPDNPAQQQQQAPRIDVGSTIRAATRDTVRLTYRGIFKRTDGKIMALLEDSRTQRSSFYAEGTRLFGVTIGSIDTETMNVVLDDGSAVSLTLGQPEIFEGGKRAN